MNSLKHFSAALLLAAVASQTLAAQPPMQPNAANMEMQMQKMRTMHDKMMAAKTPQERQKLMAEQMQSMQDGMAMMQSMDKDMMAKGMMPCQGMGAGAPDAKTMMEQRMKMMDMMQQMMGQQGKTMPMQ
ncbi:hypothetical protein PQU96_13150 [Vogesella sp. LYT5W]|uniref:Signal recognition particle subunit FFH/SRP54 (Srp54) n=1 Tax=Vogesella margarita TaxID=2984199 RepID=A0ABT5IR61_9NEIS|nr:hypothetical protein [Vogesella margarita]MDC7715061.1 hypothetical protein [Vogesella margarita]